MVNTVINGSDLGLFISTGTTSGITATQTVAFATEHKIEIKHSLRKINSKDSGQWGESAAGMMEWSLSCEALTCFDTTAFNYHKLNALMLQRIPLTICSSVYSGTTRTTGTTAYVGQAYITSLSLTAKDDDNSTMSISMEGTGPLTPQTI